MAFGGGGGFGGFGQQNNTGSAFGGFGSTSNTNTGFGAANNSAFGANTGTTGSGLFGSNNNNPGGSAFGGFGANNASSFGKTGFGAATTTSSGNGGLFATANNTSGFGLGANNNNSPFGSNTGTGLFGASKPISNAFGTGVTGASMFGGGSTTGSAFGGGVTTSAFGATNNPGIGTNTGEPPGTNGTPFAAFTEKESNNPSMAQAFQNICFQDAYKKWSPEELRLVDYNQGRTRANATGAGAFGVGTGFGTAGSGFGLTNNTGFGANNTGGSLFGNNNNQTSAFGTGTSNTGFGSSGLFGGNNTGTGLFGNNTSTSQPAQSTGMFGGGGGFGASTNNTTSAFGANTINTGGGLFGNNANKPATGFGGFGSNPPGTTSAFGNTGTTNAFGSSTTGGGLFGSNAQTATTGGGLFGNNNQQQNTTGGFGGFGAQNLSTGTGLFGNNNNQQKPATGGGLFGNSTTNTTGGGLFGNNNNSTSAFGSNTNNTAGGGLLGNKTNTMGGGMFGASITPANNTGTTSLFGGGLGPNTQTQTINTGGGLFGASLGQNNQAKPSLFGNTGTTGGGLFGSSANNQTQGNSLFGNNNAQQAGMGLGGSLLGGNMQNSQQLALQSLSTSINDPGAYGVASLFSNIPDDKLQHPGPLATPLSGQSKIKSRSILPMYKLSPANASRYTTPQKNRGHSFSYGYNTPPSASSVASTPGGLGQSLLGGSLNRGLYKSISSSNLRRSLNVEDSILTPGAFSASTSGRLLGGSGSHKKLVINRDLRSGDLFSPPAKDKSAQDLHGSRKTNKRVSFEPSESDNAWSGADNPALAGKQGKRVEEMPNSSRPPSSRSFLNGTNGSKASPSTNASEKEQAAKGNELAIVHEEGSSPVASRTADAAADNKLGEYWMSPSKEEIEQMNRVQRQKVDLTVGRECAGSIQFKVPVDLTNIDLDNLFGDNNIIILEHRSATVYPFQAKKPPVGKGLNVPAVISLEQSWPRGLDRKNPSKINEVKLKKHLERLKGIRGTEFESYDAETGVWIFSVDHFTTYGLDDEQDTELLGAPESQALVNDAKPATSPTLDPDDTFEFKHSRRPVPGAFDAMAMSDEDEPVEKAPIIGELSLESDESETHETAEVAVGEVSLTEEHEVSQLQEKAQSPSPELHQEQENNFLLSQMTVAEQQVPAGILRARMRAMRKSTAPTKIEVAGGDDWTQILQESVQAPRTVDRATLRALNESGAAWEMKDHRSPTPAQIHPIEDAAGFATSIDLMNSLFEQAKGHAQPVQAASQARGFVKWPYQRCAKVDQNEAAPVPRPAWGPNGLLVMTDETGLMLQQIDTGMIGNGARTIREMELYVERLTRDNVVKEWDLGVDAKWKLAAILMESNEPAALREFWQGIIADSTLMSDKTLTGEHKAIVCLAGNRVADACFHLVASGNFRLASLVACIGTQAKDMRAQIKDWRASNVLSEISEPVRAIYELLAGNACVCAGVKNVPIEDRAESFVISKRFGLDWKQSFGLRLFCTGATTVEDAVGSFQTDIEQGREPEPEPAGDALWALLKMYASKEFDWAAVEGVGWLLTKVLMERSGINFGMDSDAQWNRACSAFAATLTAQGSWVLGAFVLAAMHSTHPNPQLIEHLGRHADLLGAPDDASSPFALLRRAAQKGHFVPVEVLWESKALHYRSQRESKQEFLALLWARNYVEANRAFLDRLAPDLVVRREYSRLHRYAGLLHRVRNHLPDWESGALAYLVWPMVRVLPPSKGNKPRPVEGQGLLEELMVAALVRLRERAVASGHLKAQAAVADMAEDVIHHAANAGGLLRDQRLFSLLPGDARERYYRDLAVVGAA